MTLLMAVLLTAAGPDSSADEWRATLPASLSAEEPQDRESRSSREDRDWRESREERSGPKWGLGVQLQGRWSLPFGSANKDVSTFSNPGGGVSVVYQSNLSWSDLFNNGWGTSLTAEVSIVKAGRGDGGYGRSKNNMQVGVYVSFMQDHFSGTTTSDSAGTKITTDDLSMNTYLVGGTVYQNLGEGVYTEGRMGIGAVHYSAVPGTLTSPGLLGQTFQDTLFKDSWNFASEIRGAIGYRLGPLGLSVGMGFRFLAPPNEGSLVDLSPGAFMTWDIDLGAELGF